MGTGNEVVTAICDPLLAVDATSHLQPTLAVSVDHSADGRTWTFHLRHDVHWADGVSFTSADVAYNDRAAFEKKNNITGFYGKTGWDQISNYSTPDAYTFVCHLKAVNAPFLANMGNTPLVPQHIYDRPGVDFNKAPFNRAAFGTGPYMVSEWKAGDHITLVPNPYWWRGQPFFKRVVYKIVPDKNTLLVQLKTGELDMGVVLQRQVAQARTLPGKRLVTWLNNSYRHVEFVQFGFLREQVVRQALDYATPKQAIFKGILKGLGAIASSNVSPAITSYHDPNVPTHPFNLAKAAALLAATHRYSLFDHASTLFAFFGLAMPVFWFGLMLQLLFAVHLGWLPAADMNDERTAPSLLGGLRHLLLPALTLGITSIAGWSRYLRASLQDALDQDYTRTACAKGVPRRRVITRHALRNALIPLATVLALVLPGYFTGAVVVETVFSWPGLGRLFFQSLNQRDYPVQLGILLIASALIILGNLLADLVYGLLDPRITYA